MTNPKYDQMVDEAKQTEFLLNATKRDLEHAQNELMNTHPINDGMHHQNEMSKYRSLQRQVESLQEEYLSLKVKFEHITSMLSQR